MTLETILSLGIADDDTLIYIRQWGRRLNLLAYGRWYEDGILGYSENRVESFTYETGTPGIDGGNMLYIDLPGAP